MSTSTSGRIFLRDAAGQLNRLSESPYAAEDDLQRLLPTTPISSPGTRSTRTSSPLVAGQARGRRAVERRRERPLVDRPPLSRSGCRSDLGRGQAKHRQPNPARSCRPNAGLRGEQHRLLVAGGHSRAVRSGGWSPKADDPDEVIGEFLQDGDVEAFWQAAKHNLQAGRVRMIFVADVIPRELRRIVEFLNGQMDPAEVLAIEVRQFSGEDVTAPRPSGGRADRRSAPGERRRWEFRKAVGRRPRSSLTLTESQRRACRDRREDRSWTGR